MVGGTWDEVDGLVTTAASTVPEEVIKGNPEEEAVAEEATEEAVVVVDRRMVKTAESKTTMSREMVANIQLMMPTNNKLLSKVNFFC